MPRAARAEAPAGRVRSFAPIAGRGATVLILGSMPGAASLRAGRYYAHPRNLFWPILGALVGAGPVLPYRLRVRRLKAARVALWDVLRSCARPGSLDADIERGSMESNDFAGFFAAHPGIVRVFFNGATAERLFRRLVLPTLPQLRARCARLPSTSPAHAALTFEEKLMAWRAVTDALVPAPQANSRGAWGASAPRRVPQGSARAATRARRSARGARSGPGSRSA